MTRVAPNQNVIDLSVQEHGGSFISGLAQLLRDNDIDLATDPPVGTSIEVNPVNGKDSILQELKRDEASVATGHSFYPVSFPAGVLPVTPAPRESATRVVKRQNLIDLAIQEYGGDLLGGIRELLRNNDIDQVAELVPGTEVKTPGADPLDKTLRSLRRDKTLIATGANRIAPDAPLWVTETGAFILTGQNQYIAYE